MPSHPSLSGLPTPPPAPIVPVPTPAPAAKRARGGFQGAPVPQTIQGDPQLNDAMKKALLDLLGGGGFSNIDASRNLIRQEAKTGFRDAAQRRASDFGARGLYGSGAQVRDIENLERTFANARIRGINDLETANEQFGLQKTAQGIQGFGVQRGLELTESQQAIARALGINDQQLRDLISKRRAGASRYATDASLKISANQLDLQKLLGLRELDARDSDRALREKLGLGGLDAEAERSRIAELLGLGDLELGRDRFGLDTERFEFDKSIQELLQTLMLGALPGFARSPQGSGLAPGGLEEILRSLGIDQSLASRPQPIGIGGGL